MNTKRIIKIIIFCILLLICFFPVFFSPSTANGQERTANPLQPEDFQTQREIGIFAGIGPDFQSGLFRTSCDCPEFENGTGLSWIAGMLYEQDISEYFQWGAAVALNSLSITSSYQILKDRPFVTNVSGTTYYDTVPILFRQKADLSFLNINIMPYLEWAPSNMFFIRFGFSAAFNLSSNVLHREEIVNRTVKLPSSGSLVEVTFSDGSSTAVVENAPYKDVVATQFYLFPSAGFSIPLSQNIFLSPVVAYSYPLTNISNFGNGVKIASLYFIAELRWAIQLRQK